MLRISLIEHAVSSTGDGEKDGVEWIKRKPIGSEDVPMTFLTTGICVSISSRKSSRKT